MEEEGDLDLELRLRLHGKREVRDGGEGMLTGCRAWRWLIREYGNTEYQEQGPWGGFSWCS